MASNRVASDSSATSSGGGDRMEIDSNPSSRNSSLTAPSIHDSRQPWIDRTQRINRLQSSLKNLQLNAQRQLAEQPKSTQIALANQTRAIFQPYGRHGSEALLSTAIDKYLTSSTPTANLTIWSAATATKKQATARTKHDAAVVSFAKHVVDSARKDGIPMRTPASQHDIRDPRTRYEILPATPTQLTRLHEISLTDSPLNGRRTLTRSASTTSIIRSWSFHPADLTLTLPTHLDLPPQLLPTVSRILDIYNAQANAHLQHLVDKYITLAPHPERTEHAYALFRLGLLEKYTELVENLFNTRHTHPMELSQYQSAVLRDVFDGMGQSGLNEWEAELLGRMLDVHEEDVCLWWGTRGERVRAWKGTKVWVRARELEGVRVAKRTGVY